MGRQNRPVPEQATTVAHSVLSRASLALAKGSVLHAVVANSGWLMLDRILRMLLGLLVGTWVARHLGPARFGELAYWLAIIALLQTFCTLGLESIAVRDIARNASSRGEILGTILRLRLTCGVLCWLGAVGFAAISQPAQAQGLLIIAVLGPLLLAQPMDYVDLWLQSQTRSRDSVAGKSLAYVAAALIKIGLMLADAPLWAFALALTTEGLLAAASLLWVQRRMPLGQPLSWSGARAVALLKEGWPFLVAGLSVVAYMRIDQIVLRALAGEQALGIYSAVIPMSQAWHIIPMTVCASVLPRLSVLKELDPAAYRRRVVQLFAAMAWSGVLVSGATAALAPWFVELLLGQAYAASVEVLRWHAFTNVFVFLGVAQSVAIVNDGRAQLALARTLMGAGVSLGMNLWLVPSHGAVGAAWAAVASQAAAAVLSNAILAPNYLRLQAESLLFVFKAFRPTRTPPDFP